jgi:hypothetical protein
VGWMTAVGKVVAVGEGIQLLGDSTWILSCEQADTPSISKKYTEIRMDVLEVVSRSFIAYHGGSIGLIWPGSSLPSVPSRSSYKQPGRENSAHRMMAFHRQVESHA